MKVREDGDVGPLKEKCEQKTQRQNMSSLQCQAKEVPLAGFHKRRREQVRTGNYHTEFQIPCVYVILSKIPA